MYLSSLHAGVHNGFVKPDRARSTTSPDAESQGPRAHDCRGGRRVRVDVLLLADCSDFDGRTD